MIFMSYNDLVYDKENRPEEYVFQTYVWAALILLYFYIKDTHPDSDPRLTIKLMAFYPLSFFCLLSKQHHIYFLWEILLVIFPFQLDLLLPLQDILWFFL
jgi:hypothetical protein